MPADIIDAPVPESKEPVTAPGQTKLSDAWREAMKSQEAERAQPDPSAKKEEVKPSSEKSDVKPDAKADPKAEVKKEEPAKKLSALDAALESPVVKDEKTDEIPLNAPAKQLREAMERHKAEASRWKSEAEKAKSDPATKGQIESLQQEREKLTKENAELRDAITAVNVDYDPEVRAKYHDGKQKLAAATVKSVDQFGGDAKAFEDALTLPPGKARTQAIRDSLAEVDEMDRPAIYNKLAKISELEEEHAELLKNSQKSYADLTARQKERMTERQQESEKSKVDVFNKATKALPSAHPTMREVPDSVEGHEEWNARLKSDHDSGLKLLGSDASLDEISAAAVKGARYDFVEGLLMEERKTTADLRDQLKKYESAEPGFEGRHKTSVVSKLDKTPAQLYKEKLAELSGHRLE